MIFLEDSSRITEELLSKSSGKADVRYADFNDCTFRLVSDGEGASTLTLAMPAIEAVRPLGLQECLEERYEGAAGVKVSDGSVVLSFKAPSTEQAKKIALLRRYCLGFPFQLAMKAQQAGTSSPLYSIPFRQSASGTSELVWCQGHADRVTVIYGVAFDDESDATIGRVFLQEFADMRKQTALCDAPAVIVGKEPPSEVPRSAARPHLTYITFVLFPRHFDSPERQEDSISRLVSFRDYFHYHIKACKAHMHTRMRGKVGEFLTRIAAGKRQFSGQGEARKLASGKAFVPQV